MPYQKELDSSEIAWGILTILDVKMPIKKLSKNANELQCKKSVKAITAFLMNCRTQIAQFRLSSSSSFLIYWVQLGWTQNKILHCFWYFLNLLICFVVDSKVVFITRKATLYIFAALYLGTSLSLHSTKVLRYLEHSISHHPYSGETSEVRKVGHLKQKNFWRRHI